MSELLVSADVLPGWLAPLGCALAAQTYPEWFARWSALPGGSRRSAVLVALSQVDDGPAVLLLERSAQLRRHAGQPAFPGGRIEPGESPLQAALREANEETGLDPAVVQPLAVLPDLPVYPSDSRVTPVIGYLPTQADVCAQDETDAVHQVPLADLADPANRGRAKLMNGYIGPAFAVAGMVVWGFTGTLIDTVLAMGGWEQPWRPGRQLQVVPD